MTEHAPTVEEMHITSEMDFIVPLKQVGLITRTVLEAIELFYKPRRIFVISSGKEEIILLELLMKWNLTGRVFFVSEETFFAEGLNLTIESIISEYNPKREGDQREPGWWIQQLIKMGAATQIPDISTNYVVWDGELILCFSCINNQHILNSIASILFFLLLYLTYRRSCSYPALETVRERFHRGSSILHSNFTG